jgi:hypothetical protein
MMMFAMDIGGGEPLPSPLPFSPQHRVYINN